MDACIESRIRALTRWSPTVSARTVAAPMEFPIAPIQVGPLVRTSQSIIARTSSCSRSPHVVAVVVLRPWLRRSTRTRLYDSWNGGAYFRTSLLCDLNPGTMTIVGPCCPTPLAAGMYQPAIRTPSLVTTWLSAVDAPKSLHPWSPGLTAASRASSAWS